MNKPYSGNARPFVLALFAPSDAERVLPLLERLDARGYALAGQDGKATAAQAKRACAVVPFLSAAFAADDAAQATLLAADAAGVPLVPVQLDVAEQPELIRRALMATNAIMAERYDTSEALAERLCSAEALTNPQVTAAQKAAAKKTTGALVAAAACVVALVAALVVPRMQAAARLREVLSAVEQYGMTEDDLANIRSVVIVGEHVAWYTPESPEFNAFDENSYPLHWQLSTKSEDEDGTQHWYWNEDGSETTRTAYDLSFLTLLPSLEKLSLVNADISSIPSLAGLERLNEVMLYTDELGEGGLSFLEGSSVQTLDVSGCNVSDYTPLNACGQLRDVILDSVGEEVLDIAGFAPPELAILNVENASGDLASLAGCAKLKELHLTGCRDLRNLGFLSGAERLELLELAGCESLTDATALAGCPNLKRLHIQDARDLRDFSFLDGMGQLEQLYLFSVPVTDFGFLAGVDESTWFSLGFAPSEANVDFSGLANIKRFDYLHANCGGRDFMSEVLPYIKDADFNSLELYDCDGVDLSQLPELMGMLKIDQGDLTSLAGLDQPQMSELQLYDMQYLTSLDGIEGAPGLTKTSATGNKLEILACPRLTDWNALKGQHINRLELKYLYQLPDFALLNVGELRLEGIEGLSDLSCLDALPVSRLNSLELVGLPDVGDLAPAARLRNSGHLAVPPQLAEQAEALVEDGVFLEYEVAYPDSGWNPLDGGVELVSLDDLDTLPSALLARVEQLKLAGDTLFDGEENSWYEWDGQENDGKGCMVRVSDDGQTREPLGEGTLTDLSRLAPLTGLRELVLFGQPLTSLDGIQDFDQLENVQLNWVMGEDALDFAPLFACAGLHGLDLPGVGITSIQGVQNLTELEEVTLSWNEELTDLAPLLECPNLQHVRVSSNMEEALASIDGADYAFELEVEQAGE